MRRPLPTPRPPLRRGEAVREGRGREPGHLPGAVRQVGPPLEELALEDDQQLTINLSSLYLYQTRTAALS